MTKEEEIQRITNMLYAAYGSDSGYLFGLEPKYRDIVQVIIKFTLDYNKGENNGQDRIARNRTMGRL